MLSIYLSMYNSSFSKASVLVAMYAFYLKHYVYTGAQARRPMPHATSPMSHAFIPPDARNLHITDIAEGSNNLLLPLLCAQSLIGSSYNLSPLLLRAQSLIMVFLSFFFMRLDACVFSVWRMMNMMSMMN